MRSRTKNGRSSRATDPIFLIVSLDRRTFRRSAQSVASISCVSTSIHDERGVITGDRKKIHDKLFHLEHKLDALEDESQFVATDRMSGARDLVLAYGVAGNAARDAVDALRAKNHAVNLCVVECLWPMPEKAIRRAAEGCDRVIVPEHNFGQYARELERILPGKKIAKIARVDGGLISPSRIVEEVAS